MTRPRILLAKPGLDGHDRGIKVVAMGLRDAGAEVIYLGLRTTAAQIAAMKAASLDIPLVVGGTIPPSDIAVLLRLGVGRVFATGTALPDAVEGMLRLARSRAAVP